MAASLGSRGSFSWSEADWDNPPYLCLIMLIRGDGGLDQSGKGLGQGGGEAEFLAGDRMAETEKTSVQPEPTGRIGLGPIFFIAHNRATRMGQLDPDLVAAPGFQGEFDQGSLGAGFEDPIKGDGIAGFVSRNGNRVQSPYDLHWG